MDDNYVWICPVETCRHVFKMKESESWTEEVKRNVTPNVRPLLEVFVREKDPPTHKAPLGTALHGDSDLAIRK